MPGFGPRASTKTSSPLRELARQLTPVEQSAVNERREQDERDGKERVRTLAIAKACTSQRDYLKRCSTYVTDASSHFARAHRLVRAAGDLLTDERAHIVPSRQFADVKAICGVRLGLSTGSSGWGRTLSEATCPTCLIVASEPRGGPWGRGTGDRFKCS